MTHDDFHDDLSDRRDIPDPAPAPGAEPEATTELGFTLGDRLLLFIGFPLLGAALGLVLPTLSGWLLKLDLPVMRGPLELFDDWRGPWAVAGLTLGGLLLGLVVGFLAVVTSLKVTIADAWLRVERDEKRRTIRREEVDAVFVDGKQLVVLDRESRQLLRDAVESRPAEIARAFTAHGYPWTKGDPYEELYRRWVPDTPDLPGAVNALLKAREAALKKKAGDDVAELRDEVQKLGYVVRDDAARQYWRPLVRP